MLRNITLREQKGRSHPPYNLKLARSRSADLSVHILLFYALKLYLLKTLP
ncbi:MAG: hypothetical protein ACHBN1_26435 [Heteroscytonema crispum UTEX LB 1556]